MKMTGDGFSIKGLDSVLHAYQGRFFMNMSPTAVFMAYVDWASHYFNSPEKLLATVEAMTKAVTEVFGHGLSGEMSEEISKDSRFKNNGWAKQPFRLFAASFLTAEKFGQFIMSDVNGVTKHHEEMMCFIVRQMFQSIAPSNFIVSNPELLNQTVTQKGANLVRGFFNYLEDVARSVHERKPAGVDQFKVGKNLAVTPGKVVFKNNLIELIRYSPVTETVYPEPILIVPAWIMKYYILDLSPTNSLVRYLVAQGHTVFIISWKNPGAEERNLSMSDYVRLGVSEALDAVKFQCGNHKIHTVGYCLGGTLLVIAAAYLKSKGIDDLKSMSLLAAQTDFTEAGELTLFIDDSQVSFLEDLMNRQNYLKTDQMAGAFRLLRSNELIWYTLIHDYLKGERTQVTDLMAWNADSTRMPYTMHSEYLRSLFLKNDLFEGRYRVDGVPIAISNIHAPVFLVATKSDHVAPWQSVYKFLLPSDAESVTFVLTNGGHNAGIVSEPGHPGRSYQISIRTEGDTYIDPRTFKETTHVTQGSWWIPWQRFLAEHSGQHINPPPFRKTGKAALADAPGQYVLET
jgi:polyhydroxyalkanoate synthase